MKPRRPKVRSSLSALEDVWQREATRAAVEKVRAVIDGGTIPTLTPVGRLSDVELGWLVTAAIFGWIATRAQQATTNGASTSQQYLYIRQCGLEPDPWDIGAIEAILPELANSSTDWNKTLNQFSRDEMIAFLGDAYDLIGKAMLARDRGEERITRRGQDGEFVPDDPADIPL